MSIYAVIMAGGKGTRMNAPDKPKVLFDLNGKPMLRYVIDTAQEVGAEKIVISVGYLADMVIEAMGPDYTYVSQLEQKGTAYAVMMAEPELRGKPGITIILSGDHPLVTKESIQQLIHTVESGATIALLTGVMESSTFDSMSRVLTDANNLVTKNVEFKDATDEERKIRRMNLGTYAMDNIWLWDALKKVNKSPVTGEYYLTEVLNIAAKEGKKVVAVDIDAKHEAIGINTQEHLAEAREKLSTQA